MGGIDPSIKAKFDHARGLIKAERYDEARAVLRSMNHPSASKWLTKLDELDPPFPTPLASDGGEVAYEPYLTQWLEIEKTLHVVGALGLVLLAAYLLIADPLRQFLTFLLYDKPTIRDAVRYAIPALCILLALFAVWRTTQDARMRRFVLKMKPRQLRLGAIVSIIVAVIWMGLGVQQSDGGRFRLGVLWVVVAVMYFWRSLEASKLRKYGYRQ